MQPYEQIEKLFWERQELRLKKSQIDSEFSIINNKIYSLISENFEKKHLYLNHGKYLVSIKDIKGKIDVKEIT